MDACTAAREQAHRRALERLRLTGQITAAIERRFQRTVKGQHQSGGARGFHAPLADDGRRRSGDEQRPAESHHTLAGADSPARGIARRQHHEIGMEIELHQLPRLQHAVLLIGRRPRQNEVEYIGLALSTTPCVAR